MAETKAPAKKTPSSVSGRVKKTKTPQSGDISIIETGGKQYMVSEGMKVKVEAMKGDHKVGDKVTFDKVLLSQSTDATTIGTPFIPGAAVEAEIIKISRHPKVVVIKYKAKSRYYKKRGHRQPYFEVQISKIA